MLKHEYKEKTNDHPEWCFCDECFEDNNNLPQPEPEPKAVPVQAVAVKPTFPWGTFLLGAVVGAVLTLVLI